MPEVRIKFRGKKVEVVTEGYGGESCRQATEAIEKRLGKVTREEATDDYYKAEVRNDLEQ